MKKTGFNLEFYKMLTGEGKNKKDPFGLTKENKPDLIKWISHSKENRIDTPKLKQMTKPQLIKHYTKIRRQQNKSALTEAKKLLKSR